MKSSTTKFDEKGPAQPNRSLESQPNPQEMARHESGGDGIANRDRKKDGSLAPYRALES